MECLLKGKKGKFFVLAPNAQNCLGTNFNSPINHLDTTNSIQEQDFDDDE